MHTNKAYLHLNKKENNVFFQHQLIYETKLRTKHRRLKLIWSLRGAMSNRMTVQVHICSSNILIKVLQLTIP